MEQLELDPRVLEAVKEMAQILGVKPSSLCSSFVLSSISDAMLGCPDPAAPTD